MHCLIPYTYLLLTVVDIPNGNVIVQIVNRLTFCLAAMYVLMSHMYKARVKKLGLKKWKLKLK